MPGKFCGLGLLILSLLFSAGCSYQEAKKAVKSATVNQNNSDTNKLKYILSEFSLTNGTDYLMAAVYSDYAGNGRWSSPYASSEYGEYTKKDGSSSFANNYMIMNRQNLASRKLFSDNKFVILDSQKLGESGKEGTVSVIKNVKALMFRVVKADTNNDKILDNKDKQVIALADVDGSNYQELIVGIDRVLNIHSQSKDRRVVFYQIGKDYFAGSINIPSRSVQIQKLASLQDAPS
jgi:hypothetical protein